MRRGEGGEGKEERGRRRGEGGGKERRGGRRKKDGNQKPSLAGQTLTPHESPQDYQKPRGYVSNTGFSHECNETSPQYGQDHGGSTNELPVRLEIGEVGPNKVH